MAWATGWNYKVRRFCKIMTTGLRELWQAGTVQTMKLKLSVLIFLLAAPLLPAQTNNLTALLQQGLFEEQANRNLDAAIIDYQSLALQFDKDRQLAATAIFRLGECYRAQGKTNEAAAQYQRILRDFSDQTTLATLSGQDLAGMGQSAVQNPLKATTQSVSENNVEQMRELEIVKKLQAMPLAQINQLAPTLLADGTLINLIDQFNQGELAKRPTPVLNEIGDRIHERLDGISQALTLELGLTGNVAAAASTNTLSSGSDTIDDEAKEIIRIQQLIQNSPDLINTAVPGGTTPLATAAAHGWLKVATYLLDHGADANVSAVAHVSPLIEATKAGNRAMVELLLSRGANLNSTGDSGKKPVHIAAENNFPAVLDVLLDKGADVNALDGLENTPLVRAAEKGNQAIASLLLAHHANVNTKNYLGETALITAARSNSPQIVKQLLGAGAESNTLT
jgi:ankyrin repeat protein